MLTIKCQCGEVFHADESHAGRAIRCRKCGQILGIGTSPPTMGRAEPAEIPRQETHEKPSRRPRLRRWIGGLAIFVAALVVFALISVYRGTDRGPAVQSVPGPKPPAASLPSRPPFVSVPKTSIPSPYRPEEAPKISKLSPPPLLPVRKPPTNRLKTGVNIWEPVGTSGRGTLRIHNGTNYDAAVALLDIDTNETRRFVYIRAGDVAVISAIPPCQGQLSFALGHNWDGAEGFLEDESLSVFERPLQFEESRRENGIEYATYSVTLHPVPQGKARTRRLSKEEFLTQLHRSRNNT